MGFQVLRMENIKENSAAPPIGAGELEVTVLGSGTSQGVPIIGETYPDSYLANPRNHRTRPSVLVRSPETSIVIDTTPEFRIQCLRESIRHLDGVFVTHAHADHIMGMDDCRRFCDHKTGVPFPVYASEPTHQQLRIVFGYAFANDNVPVGYFKPDARTVENAFEFRDLSVEPVWLPHGRVTCTGYLFKHGNRKVFGYLTDCKEVPEEAIEQVAGVDVVILDALRFREHPTHMCFDEALTAARRIGARETYFTHLTHDYDHDLHQNELPPGVHLAWDGLRIRAGMA